jgi:hypothetical protein
MDILTGLVDLYRRCCFPVHQGLKIIGLRGCEVVDGQVVLVDDTVDHFNDTLFLVDFLRRRIDHVPCTAGQPGWHWINAQRKDGSGAPFARPGLFVYERGLHRGKQALRQVQDATGVVPVIRNVTGDGVPDYDSHSADRFDYPLDTGINIHACTGTPSNVGMWSAGCTVVQGDWSGVRWQTVRQYVYDTYAEQTRFPFAILPAAWLFDTAKRLLWGSMDSASGGPVSKLQRFLDVEVTGRFLKDTDVAYRAHQPWV